ncbi:nucleoside-diphosphate kinase [Mammaliicoccus sciuri]|jgi:nucleoside-diphosphate kinase|uniref:Nucleoside diphosphate kinase n=1 Tax=Mammaliicoccus sciuri TaxID=1296 RepID=A0AAI8GTM4_MAMSC|nr:MULTISPECIES: nucleoside-diphosphate kinase [Mammaliicoccus]OOV37739.1 nucleoside-diphosphate kinase [Staphylococcus sp. MB371]ARB40701.1 nucleoside-diphosphate kinase [Mammaliicoccus sciuri]ASE34138.1 nucleoside-diphosphate kinase [Mammaliicoccus sciuri]KTT84351.1 nucleoside diphosphate kinase [Mammaliicoccus sciuri]KTT87007.1 nucleoside diphosphate kinase [Mammaliicoccus sciuri]
MERTFLMIKPDAVQRNLIGEVVSRLERKGLKLVAAKLFQANEELAKEHYAEHVEKPFFNDLVSFITSGPVFAMVVEGKNVVEVTRTLVGETNPTKAAPGTIRGDYGIDLGRNIIHGSDSNESAEREIGLWFDQSELNDYKLNNENWVYEK